MNRLFLVILIVLSSVPALGAGADDAYREAKAEYLSLKGDPKRRTLRHHWYNVAKKFEGVASQYPKSERAPESLFQSGEMYNELSRLSVRDDDREAAKRSYRKLLEGWPKHRLADDVALSLARLLADRDGDPTGARRVLEGALHSAGDKKKEMQAMLAALPPAPARVAVKKSAPVASKPVALPQTDIAQAIARAVKPLRLDQEEESIPVPQARRLKTNRPPEFELVPEGKDEEPVLENSEPLVANLAEKLRDVRVGARVPGKDDTETRSKFKNLAKAEGDAEFSLAQQLGLKVRRVVIDAGHGGHDTGAIGPNGTREKDVSLAIAKKLAARLEEAGLEVLLTRDDDTYVKLEDRAQFANRHRGDLFISVHCNAAPSRALRGIETYTLNTSSNRYSIRLAARENATTERGVGDLQFILADLATKANTGESTHLAQRVQKSLIRNLSNAYDGIKDLGTKEALFFVLLGAKMPSILVETSFLSHPEDERRLGDGTYQQKVADSIAEAVKGFLEERNKFARID